MNKSKNSKRVILAVPNLSKGSGLSRYVLTVTEILINNGFQVAVLTTHENQNDDFGKAELKKINPDILYKPFFSNESKIIRYFKTLRFIRSYKPDILINNYNGLIQQLLPFISAHTKVFHVIHNDAPDFYRMASLNGSNVYGYIAPTNAIAENFNTYSSGRYANRVKVISHGVRDSGSEIADRNHNKPLSLLFVGVLSTHKGPQFLYPITEILKNKDINFSLTIIGDGVLAPEMKHQFDPEIKSGKVRMTGVIPHEDVYKEMSKADIFLYPTNCDAFGLVIAEAMMNGAVPVVGLIPGVTDNLVKEGFDGYLVKPTYVKGFADRIEQLHNDRELLSQLSLNSYDTAKNKLSESIMTGNYLNIFNNL
ncbi:MAG: glycosyltransferase family 4 protein [Muribaculaceae bacterium]|nr:glycosyltransferase family 4 protein [Muribaculaceae bacterium]